MFLLSPPGVYRPQDDTSLLLEALVRERLATGARVLDVGTGSGALALAAARLGSARVTAVDASRRAVLTARINALLARRRVRVHRGDLFAPVTGRTFDLVLANPPYVPSPHRHLPRRGPALAWDAGRDGRAVLDRICHTVPQLLRPGGVVLIVHSGLCDPERTARVLESSGLNAGITARRHVPFGPVMRERAAWLRAQGLLRPGEEREELAVVRGERVI
ncbi:HemK2/MTQ2 family protein methyltransferase [Streptomyces sp. RFCAC02]|uniref:HemK2/MTQ2 family protein methyltransferase n=1 Tax=Streptomyces sp. RFCAC02 TaxID=2499143 RepID=UPI001F0EEE96|nr:HemK2/MTQ2 family protein methyltransferase [Streptomyces sp. RFCAC02]